MVDYHYLPIGGSNKYIVDKNSISGLIKSNNRKYDIIVDIPNMLDQALYSYRYSEPYYKSLKKMLNNNGIAAQVINLSNIRNEFASMAYNGFNSQFSKCIGFQCADYLIIMASNDKNAFDINEKNIKYIHELFNRSPEINYLFYNEIHLLSHCIFSDISLLNNENKNITFNFTNYFKTPKVGGVQTKKYDLLNESGNEALKLLSNDKESDLFKRKIERELSTNNELFTNFKIADIAGVERDYEREAETLTLIEKKYGHRAEIKKFIQQISSLKMDYYFNTAVDLEKEKKWDEAIKLYSAMLKLNSNDFNANYRMGLLYITLQNMNDAFIYMKQAMKLKNDDPRCAIPNGSFNVFKRKGLRCT